MEKYNLVVEYDNKTIAIPFGTIRDLDTFTLMFDNYKSIGEKLSEVFKFKNKYGSVSRVYVGYKNMFLPVLYSSNRYDLDDLKNKYAIYLSKNYDSIISTNFALDKIVKNYLNKMNSLHLLERDIKYIVNIYFASYSRERNAYFELLKYGYKVVTNKDILDDRDKHSVSLDKLDSDDEYIDYLIRYSMLGEDENNKALEILSEYDIEDLKQMTRFSNQKLFDGASREDAYDMMDVDDVYLALRALSNLTVEQFDLAHVVNKKNRNTKR